MHRGALPAPGVWLAHAVSPESASCLPKRGDAGTGQGPGCLPPVPPPPEQRRQAGWALHASTSCFVAWRAVFAF